MPGRGIMAPSQRREVSEASPSLKWGTAWGDQEIPSPAWDEQPFPNPHRDRQQESERSPGSPSLELGLGLDSSLWGNGGGKSDGSNKPGHRSLLWVCSFPDPSPTPGTGQLILSLEQHNVCLD